MEQRRVDISPAEFKSFDDLLAPRLQGKIGISDPRTPGSGSSMWSYMNYIKGEEFLKRFAGQKLFVTRDLRLLAENLARGKIAVTSGIAYSEFLPFIKAGLPVTPLPVPKEGLYVSGGYGHLMIFKNQPHPECDQGLRELVTGPRRTGAFLPWDGRWYPPPRCRYQMAERVRRHRGEGRSFDPGTVPQIRKPIGGKDLKVREPGAAVARKLLGE